LKMTLDPLHSVEIASQLFRDSNEWVSQVYHGIADSATAEVAKTCPNFGEPGWAPFCFLNGNPVFKAFDGFQYFIQNSVVSLHDFLHARGVEQAYGPSIILFTVFIRLILFPLNYKQLASTQMVQALNPKVQEIREKYADNRELQAQMTALLYQEAKTNPFAGCLPSLIQIPVFLALYRSFYNLASTNQLQEPFLWLPNLQGPVYGSRTTDWLTANWHDFTPSLGWHDTLAFFSIPVMLYVAQAISLKILSPPSDDPAVQKSQQILKYLPLMLAYFSLSVPAGLGIYWITNNLLSTATTLSIKAYFKANPVQFNDIQLDKLASQVQSAANGLSYPEWGYNSEEDMIAEAKANFRPSRSSIIPN